MIARALWTSIFRAWKSQKGGKCKEPPNRPGSDCFFFDPPKQPDLTAKSSKGYRRVIIEIQGKQFALNGWRYARSFRS